MKREIEGASADVRARRYTAESNGEISGVAREEITRLLALRHQDPHSILGIHLTDRGVIVRAYQPGASAVFLLIDDDDRHPMLRHETGLFDLLLKDHQEAFKYRLEVHYPDGGVFTLRQPYAFLPTLGDLDLHLWSEGSRERAWERLALVNARSRAFRALRSPYGRRTPPVSASSGFQWDRSKHFERERHCSHAYCAHKKTATSPASGFYRCLQLFAGRVNRLSTRSIGRFSTPRGSLWRQQQGQRPGVYSRIRQLRTVSILTDARATTTRSRMARGTKRGMMAEYS